MSVCSTATPSDGELLDAFVRNNSESAFRSLVERHARWMFAAAFRQLRDRQLAEDAAQAVFIILLQKAHAMPPNTQLFSWLFRALQFTVKNIRRAQRRRGFHEFRAAVARDINGVANPAAARNDLTDRLDIAVASLPTPDRATILLRFYQNLPFDQIGRSLGISEAAARKRTHRAIHALRRKLGADATAGSISLSAAYGLNHSPAALIHTITSGVFAAKAGAAIPGTILTATKGTLFFMAATKAKIIAVVVIIFFLAVPGTIVAIHYAPSFFDDSQAVQLVAKPVEANQAGESWQVENISSDRVGRLAPEVRILPTKFPHSQQTRVAGFAPGSDKYVGIRVTSADILTIAYKWHSQRIIFANGLSHDRYDFIATLPQGSLEALQAELKDKLGLVAHPETRNVDVLLLKVKNPNARGLKPPTKGEDFYFQTDDNNADIHWENDSLSRIPDVLEGYCGMPIIDETALTPHFSIDVRWKELGERDPNHAALKKALLNTLGLELVPARAPVEMLIVEKVDH